MALTAARSAAAIKEEPVTAIMATNPVVYWRMNEASGNLVNIGSLGSKDAVANGTPAYQVSKLPQRSKYTTIDLDGTADYFRVTDAAITGTNPNFSFGCWISTSAGLTAMTVFQQQDTDSSYCGFRLYTNGGVLIFESHHTDTTTQPLYAYGLTEIQDGTPIYVGVTADATHFNIYVNGASKGTLARTTVTYVSGSDIYIGRAEGPYRYWDGLISDLFITQQVLTSDEHASIWRAGNLGTPRPRGDNFKDIVVLTEGVMESLTSVGASASPDDPINSYSDTPLMPNSIWLKFVPGDDQYLLEFDATTLNYVIWVGDDDLIWQDPTWNDYNYLTYTSGSTLLDTLDDGRAYYIEVGGSTAGAFDMTVSEIIPPANDNFANAITISVVGADDIMSNTIGATVEDEQECVSNSCNEHSVWYKFTADATGNITLSADDSETYLYIGIAAWDATADGITTVNDVDWTSPLDADESSSASGNGEITIAVTNGHVYYVQVSSGDDVPDGDVILSWTDIT